MPIDQDAPRVNHGSHLIDVGYRRIPSLELVWRKVVRASIGAEAEPFHVKHALQVLATPIQALASLHLVGSGLDDPT